MSIRKKISIIRNCLIFTLIAWFIVTFMIIPVISVVRTTFFSGGSFTFESIRKLASSTRVKNALINTYVVGFWTVITVTIVGTFQIMVTEYFDIKGAKLLEFAFMTPLVYGGIALVTGYNYLYGPRGFVTSILLPLFPNMNQNWFSGFRGVMLVHTFAFTRFHILFVKTAFKRIDYSTIEASRSMGVNSFQTFIKIALPVIKPSLFSATILLLLTALNSFAAPSMLGGRNFYMINSIILSLNGLRSYDLSSLLSLILAITCIVLLLLMRYLEKKNSYISVSKVPTQIRKMPIRNPVLNIIVHIISYALVVIYLLPIAVIILFSFGDIQSIVTATFPKSFSLANYIHVFSTTNTLKPFANSVKISLIAVLIVLAITIASAIAIHKKPGKATTLLEMTLLIPWILPATMLVVGMITAFSMPNILVFNMTLLGGFWLMPIAYAVGKIPSAMRLIRASLYTINDSHEEASRSLGASAFYTFRRVMLPAIMPTAISVGAIAFNGLLSEYTVSALLYNVNNITLGIVMRSPELATDPNQEANTLVYIVVLMIISGITLAATQKHRNKI